MLAALPVIVAIIFVRVSPRPVKKLLTAAPSGTATPPSIRIVK
jgi:hypothetical protein